GSGELGAASEYTSRPKPTMASITTPAPNSATRTRIGTDSGAPQHVADPAHCLQHPWLSVGFEFVAQVANIDVDEIAFFRRVAPRHCQQRIATEHLARAAQELFEQLELLRGELDL